MVNAETYKTTIIIKTDAEEIEVNVNTSIARGWNELQAVISREMQDAAEMTAVAQVNPKAGAGLFITKEVENAKAYIEALKIALNSSEFGKIEGIVEYMDIRGLRAIAVEILNRYIAYYDERVKEFAE